MNKNDIIHTHTHYVTYRARRVRYQPAKEQAPPTTTKMGATSGLYQIDQKDFLAALAAADILKKIKKKRKKIKKGGPVLFKDCLIQVLIG